MSAMGSNGTNGHATPTTIAVSELETQLALYRTSLVAILQMVKREGGWRSTADQQLIRQIERVLADDPISQSDFERIIAYIRSPADK